MRASWSIALAVALTGAGCTADEPLRAAAGHRVISPDATNHPETVYLAGVVPSRVATGVHDDLLASGLVLSQGDEHVVLVSVDLTGFTRSRIREVQERLAPVGLDPDRVWIASTHTHEAPDMIGVYGPDLLTSGVSPSYVAFVQDQIVDLVEQLWDEQVPVDLRATIAEVHDPGSSHPTWIDDTRHPEVTVPTLGVAAFEDEDGSTVASLVNWHSHPEVMIRGTEVSSDFPTWTRQSMEDALGGTAVYLTGAVGGLSTPIGVSVPVRDQSGQLVLDDGEPVYQADPTWETTRSMGLGIAELALEALGGAEPAEDPVLEVRVAPLLVPLDNPMLQLAFIAGLVEYDDQDLIDDQPDRCGEFGCADERVGLLRLGPLGVLTSPGETFPETWIGRPESTHDFGEPWGAQTFAAMDGLEPLLDVEVPMHMGLCGDEIGYLLPEADAHEPNHPEYYEEELVFGTPVEALYREVVGELLAE